MSGGKIIIDIPEIPEDCYSCDMPDDAGYCRYSGIYADHTELGKRPDECLIMSEDDHRTLDEMRLRRDQEKELLKALEDIAQNQQRWIPVMERPPRNYIYVLTCDEDKTERVAMMDSSGEWISTEGAFLNSFKNIVAYMPLPEPWEGETDEE